MNESTRHFSDLQEIRLAKILGAKRTPNSGGTKFGGGDVITDHFLIEAKTTTKPLKSFSIKSEWLTKAAEQAFEQGKRESILAFNFKPDDRNYFILDEAQFKTYLDYMEEIYKNE